MRGNTLTVAERREQIQEAIARLVEVHEPLRAEFEAAVKQMQQQMFPSSQPCGGG